MELMLHFGIPVLTFIIVIITALAVWAVSDRGPKSWTDEDCVEWVEATPKPFLRHVADCGLIYPVLFVYVLFGINGIVEWMTGRSFFC
ncbi:hypothetical protein D9M68_19210 [compost metagenome]